VIDLLRVLGQEPYSASCGEILGDFNVIHAGDVEQRHALLNVIWQAAGQSPQNWK
jgi:hypothetical protein